jgi:two-component system response regulator
LESMLQSLNTNLTNSMRFVHDGAEAVDYIFGTGAFKKRDILNTPDLVMLDLGLTKVDALEIVGKMRGDPSTSSIPVIALVSQSDQDLGRAKQLGVTDFITMPIDFTGFVRSLSQAGFGWTIVDGSGKR